MGGFGECLPYHSNYVEVDKEKLDAWGSHSEDSL